MTPEDETVSGEFEGHFGVRDLFHRSEPASMEGPADAWSFADLVIDHGCHVLVTVNEVREGRVVRDTVTAALLRRALVSAEGIRVLLRAGLEEPASALFRTLLDIELSLRLVVQDDTDQMAKRLAAYYFLTGKRHFTRQLADAGFRERVEDDADHYGWTKDTAKRMKEYLHAPGFDEIRTKVEKSQYWHGHQNVFAAFKAAGMDDDYLSLYSLFSPFTHASNLDFDFAEIDSEGRPQLRPLPQRDPSRTLNVLKGACLKLIAILQTFLKDHGNPQYQQPFQARMDDGTEFEIGAIDALLAEAVSIYGSEGDVSGKEPDAA